MSGGELFIGWRVQVLGGEQRLEYPFYGTVKAIKEGGLVVVSEHGFTWHKMCFVRVLLEQQMCQSGVKRQLKVSFFS